MSWTVPDCGMLLNNLQLSLWSGQPASCAQWVPLYRMYISLFVKCFHLWAVSIHITDKSGRKSLLLLLSNAVPCVSAAKMNIRFCLKYPRSFHFSFRNFKAHMQAAGAYGCGTKALVSLAEVNDTWGTAAATVISATQCRKQKAVVTDWGGSQSPATVYLKSIVMRRNVFV